MAFDIVLIIGFCIKIQKKAACNNTIWKNQIFYLNEKHTRSKFRHKNASLPNFSMIRPGVWQLLEKVTDNEGQLALF